MHDPSCFINFNCFGLGTYRKDTWDSRDRTIYRNSDHALKAYGFGDFILYYEGPNTGGRKNWVVRFNHLNGMLILLRITRMFCNNYRSSVTQVYLESYTWDPNCDLYLCGRDHPYMYYDGDEFCVQDANRLDGWHYVDYSAGGSFSSGPVVVENTCRD